MRKIWTIFGTIFLLLIVDGSNDCKDPKWHSFETNESARENCGLAFENRCLCFRTCYDGLHQYVVNCTDSGFHDTTPLEHLPNETQVLIFTGNDIEELPWNVFGTLDSLPYLKVIDMSNNKIRQIRGKAYHHVQNVERLILDFNKLSFGSGRSHPRMFSNFVSLLELHLTDAFEDDAPSNVIATVLHDIFVSSNLTRLMKLHLEQNEIRQFKDENVFCDLPNLWDLHLGDNGLTGLHFNLTCLPKLRFLDLQRNQFPNVRERDLITLDNFAKHNQSVTVDFSGNPLKCDCKLNSFIDWMNQTKIFIRNNETLRCFKGGIYNEKIHKVPCLKRLTGANRHGTTIILCFLTTILIGFVCALVYVHKNKVQKKLEPVFDSMSKRVRYTSIATGDAQQEV